MNFYLLFIGVTAAFFIVPLVILQFMPGKKSLFIAACLSIAYIAYELQALVDYPDDWDTGFFIYCFAGGVFFGVVLRTFKLAFKRKKAEVPAPFWTWREWATVGTVVITLLFWDFMGRTGICVWEGRKLNETELIDRYLVGSYWYKLGISSKKRNEKLEENSKKFAGYYKISEAGRSLTGAYRVYLKKYIRRPEDDGRDYDEISTKLNACGRGAGSYGKMGARAEEVQTAIEKYNFVKIGIDSSANPP